MTELENHSAEKNCATPLARLWASLQCPRPASQADNATAAGRPRLRDWASYGLLLFVFLLGCKQLRDVDVWWHLRTGQLILQRWAFPRTDWFTYTSPDAPWIDLNWLWQLLSLGAWNLGGATALIVLAGLLGVATFGFIILGTARNKSVPWAASLALLPAVMLFSLRYPVRPEMLSFAYLGMTLFVCYHLPARPGLVYVLPGIQVLWVNTHASFVLELVVVGCFLAAALGRRLSPRLRRFTSGDSRWKSWLLAALLCAGATLANPYGIRGALFFRVVGSRLGSGETAHFYKFLAGELHSVLELNNPTTTCQTALASAVAVLSFLPFVLRRRVNLPRILLLGCFAHLGWQSCKNLPYLAIASAAVVYWNLADWPLAWQRAALRKRPIIRLVRAATLVLLVVAAPASVFQGLNDAFHAPQYAGAFGFGELPGAYCHAESQFLGAPGMPQRVFACDHSMASAYIFHNGPEKKVFLDGRLEVSSREQYERWLWIITDLIERNPKAEEELLEGIPPDSRGVREMPALLIDLKTCALHHVELLHHPRWRPVFMGATAIVLVYEPDAQRLGLASLDTRKADELLVKVLELHSANQVDFRFLLGQTLVQSDPVEAIRCFRLAVSMQPDFAEAHYNLAMLLEKRAPEDAEEHYRLTLQYSPNSSNAHNNYANLLARRKEYRLAVSHYRRAIELNPQYEMAKRNLATALREMKSQAAGEPAKRRDLATR